MSEQDPDEHESNKLHSDMRNQESNELGIPADIDGESGEVLEGTDSYINWVQFMSQVNNSLVANIDIKEHPS